MIGSALDLYDVPIVKEGQDAEGARLRRAPDALRRAHLEAEHFRGELALARGRMGEHGCPYCVHDVDDPDARVPLVAHVEHWETRAVFDVLAAALVAPDASAAAEAAHHAAEAAEAY